MDKSIRVMIVDDNPINNNMLCEFVRHYNKLELVASAGNGLEALQYMESKRPDVVVLDLVMPVLDGIGVLERMRNMPKPKPYIIVLTAMGTESMVQRAMSVGADYYMVKPFEIQQLYKRIIELVEYGDMQSAANSSVNGRPSTGMSIDEEITSMFHIIGIPANIQGYKFMRAAIKMAVSDITIIHSLTKRLYPSVAVEFDTTASKVERAIRHCIDVAWQKGRIENINDIFGYSVYNKYEKPSSGEFIALLADKLYLEHVETKKGVM